MDAALCYASRTLDDPAVAPLIGGEELSEEQQAALAFLKQANAELCGFSAFLVAG
jgi:hypothetical protein